MCIVETFGCRGDFDCPSQTGCINKLCENPCNVSSPCGINSKCKVLDTFPIRTMTCECIQGTQGNAAIRCDEGILQQLLLLLTNYFFTITEFTELLKFL